MVKFLRTKFWSGDGKRMAESEAMQTEARAPLASGEVTESPGPAQMSGLVSEFTRGKEYKVRVERLRDKRSYCYLTMF